MNEHINISMRYIVGSLAALLIFGAMLLIGITAVGNGKRDWGTPLPGRVTSLSKVQSTGGLFGLFASHFRYAEIEVLHTDDQWQTWRDVIVKDEVVKHQGTKAWVHSSGEKLMVDVAGLEEDGLPWTPLEDYIILGLFMGAAAFSLIVIALRKDEGENGESAAEPDDDEVPPDGVKAPEEPDGADPSPPEEGDAPTTDDPGPEERLWVTPKPS